MMDTYFTKTQQSMLNVLADGRVHTREELRLCLPDDLGTLKNVRTHISNIRKKLRPKGLDILCVLDGGKPQYRQVRLLSTAD